MRNSGAVPLDEGGFSAARRAEKYDLYIVCVCVCVEGVLEWVLD